MILIPSLPPFGCELLKTAKPDDLPCGLKSHTGLGANRELLSTASCILHNTAMVEPS